MNDLITIPLKEYQRLLALAEVADRMLEAARPLVLTKLKLEDVVDRERT